MKILIVFIDMVRVDHLKLYNPNALECQIDRRLQHIGGTLFTNCYSPGPDTPRSMACVQTGLYPQFNGCDTRIKWPKYFVKEDLTTIWDHASEKGMTVNLCCNKSETVTGFFKYSDSDNIHLFYSPEEFFQGGMFTDNSLSFYGIPDMHTAISDYYASEYSFKKGDSIVDSHFKKYLTDAFLSQFDYTLFFSDHGFQLWEEQIRMKSSLELLNDSRNQLLMLVHKKGDKEIKRDKRLASIIDLYSTIEQLIGGEEYRQGYSLLGEPLRSIAHVEDHKDFKVYPEIMVKQWRVISNRFDILTDVNNTVIKKGTEKDKQDADSYLRQYSPKYADYVKQLEVQKFYDSLYLGGTKRKRVYFSGLDRDKKSRLYLFRLYYKLKGYLYKVF